MLLDPEQDSLALSCQITKQDRPAHFCQITNTCCIGQLYAPVCCWIPSRRDSPFSARLRQVLNPKALNLRRHKASCDFVYLNIKHRRRLHVTDENVISPNETQSQTGICPRNFSHLSSQCGFFQHEENFLYPAHFCQITTLHITPHMSILLTEIERFS